MLPFEVPPTFSNRGFYRFIRRNSIEISNRTLRWVSPDIDRLVFLLFGVEDDALISTSVVSEWGKVKTVRSVSLNKCRMDTNPFAFKIAHHIEGRVLAVVHPRNQLQVADFYHWYSSLILYHTGLSEYSIRRPSGVAKFSYFSDSLHDQRRESGSGIEIDDREYDQTGSYFTYTKYRNIHRFFESYSYHRSEKKFDSMVQIDISRCFDSIYTHSLPWATMGKEQVKNELELSKSTFGGRFDALLQNMNNKETNGIVIGPEFSRIFAEIILQAVDVRVQNVLLRDCNITHKIDYRTYRYVDDYFVFFNKESTKLAFLETLQAVLREFKLSINAAKTKTYERPIITPITLAKEAISELFNADFNFDVETITATSAEEGDVTILVGSLNANRLIVRYKTILHSTSVSYDDLLNYTLAIVERKSAKLLALYDEVDDSIDNQRRLIKGISAILEFSFFAYSGSPKVNHTIRLTRLCSSIGTFMEKRNISKDLRHVVLKYIHDNIVHLLEKNQMDRYREVETLYLLLALGSTGKEYWLPEEVLRRYAGIKVDDKTQQFSREKFLNHFSITVLLTYMKDKVRYNRLRSFVEAHAVEKLTHSKEHCHGDAESMMLFLDLLVCPYIADGTKLGMAALFKIDDTMWQSIADKNSHWFTAWGNNFDLGKELDAKRGRQVY